MNALLIVNAMVVLYATNRPYEVLPLDAARARLTAASILTSNWEV